MAPERLSMRKTKEIAASQHIGEGQTELSIAAALAEELARGGPEPQPFPGGYVRVAHRLRADVLWPCCRFCEPGGRRGTAFDGFVELDGRFAWFPKPWNVRALGSVAAQWADLRPSPHGRRRYIARDPRRLCEARAVRSLRTVGGPVIPMELAHGEPRRTPRIATSWQRPSRPEPR